LPRFEAKHLTFDEQDVVVFGYEKQQRLLLSTSSNSSSVALASNELQALQALLRQHSGRARHNLLQRGKDRLVCVWPRWHTTNSAYPSMSAVHGAIKDDYAWRFTAAYMSGIAPAATFLLFWAFALVASYFYMSQRSVKATPFETHNEDRNTRLSNYQRGLLVARVLLLVCINVIIVLVANIAYVKFLTQNYPHQDQDCAKVLFVIFKLTWNSLVMPSLSQGQDHKHDIDKASLRTLLLVFNNIIAPCFATAVSDSRCFVTVFYAAPSITSPYSTCHEFSNSNKCVGSARQSVTTHPTFDYQWQCSSALVTNYSPVFALIAMQPFVNILYTCIARCWIKAPPTSTAANKAAAPI